MGFFLITAGFGCVQVHIDGGGFRILQAIVFLCKTRSTQYLSDQAYSQLSPGMEAIDAALASRLPAQVRCASQYLPLLYAEMGVQSCDEAAWLEHAKYLLHPGMPNRM